MIQYTDTPSIPPFYPPLHPVTSPSHSTHGPRRDGLPLLTPPFCRDSGEMASPKTMPQMKPVATSGCVLGRKPTGPSHSGSPGWTTRLPDYDSRTKHARTPRQECPGREEEPLFFFVRCFIPCSTDFKEPNSGGLQPTSDGLQPLAMVS